MQDTKVSHAWQQRHGSGISLFFQCFPDMTITFASIQMVEQNVEETDTSKTEFTWTFPVDMVSQIFQEVNTVVVRMSI